MPDQIDNDKISSFHPIEGFLTVNERDHLVIEGLDTVDLAAKYGTPVYIVSEDRIRDNFRIWLNAFQSRYRRTLIFYALKANPLLAVCRIVQQEGAGFEVGGPGELYTAQLLGIEPERIILNGNNKSREQLANAIKIGTTINIDSIDELNAVQVEAAKCGANAKVALRINPNVGPEDETVHSEIWTGLRECKFGIDVESGLAFEAFKISTKMKNVKVAGIHVHIGSPVEDTRPYRTAVRRVMHFVGILKKEVGISLDFINLGGGFAIPFKYKSDVPSPDDYADTITSTLMEGLREFDLNEMDLVLEIGGALVGDSAILLLTVGMTKETPGVSKWVAVDGGANILLRASQGWYNYQFVTANRMNDEPTEVVNIAGPLCYSGDVLARGRRMPKLRGGDILAAIDAGAYTFTYEFHGGGSYPIPPIVLVSDGTKDELIRRGEKLADLVSRDIVPVRLLKKKLPS